MSARWLREIHDAGRRGREAEEDARTVARLQEAEAVDHDMAECAFRREEAMLQEAEDRWKACCAERVFVCSSASFLFEVFVFWLHN